MVFFFFRTMEADIHWKDGQRCQVKIITGLFFCSEPLYATRAMDVVQNVSQGQAAAVAAALLAYTNMNNSGHFGLYHPGMEVRLTQTLAAPHVSSTQAQAGKLSEATSPSSSSRLATILKGKLQTATNQDQWGAPTKNYPNSQKCGLYPISISYYVLINMPPGKTNGWNPQLRFSSEEFPFQFGLIFRLTSRLTFTASGHSS